MMSPATSVPAPKRRAARGSTAAGDAPAAKALGFPIDGRRPGADARRRIGQRLAERLWSAEQAVDAALTEAAALVALLPRARRDAALAATVGQPAFDAAAASVVALTQARRDLVGAHHALAALARRLGLDALAAGPMDKPKDDRPGSGYGGG